MNEGSIGLFIARKGLSALEIHNELIAVLGPEAVAYSTITKYRRQRHFPTILSEPAEEPPLTIIDGAILDALDKQPLSSIRELVKFICAPMTTVSRHLTSSFGFIVKHRQWIPHQETEAQRTERVTLSANYCASFAQSSIKIRSSFSPLMSDGSSLLQTMSRSGFDKTKCRPNDRDRQLKTRK
jgi:hypothetical protein